MGIWIRSQDKKSLIELKEAWIIKGEHGEFIINLKSNSLNWYTGGKYSTEEKAVKVLDTIQETIKEPIYQVNIAVGEFETHNNIVIEMPQNDEVIIDG